MAAPFLVRPDITSLIAHAQRGDRSAWDVVYRQAYRRLHAIAAGLLRKERLGHSLPPTALIGESYLKVHRMLDPILGREHFFSLSARTMRQALIDHARRRAVRRLDPAAVAGLLAFLDPEPLDLVRTLAVKDALAKLRELDPEGAEAIRLRYVEGCTIEEAARRQGRPVWDARRDCEFGLQWMADYLR